MRSATMNLGFLAVLLCGGIFTSSALRSETEDPFEQRMEEMVQSASAAGDELKRAGDKFRATTTEDPHAYNAALDEYNAARAEFWATALRLEPSKLDMWEARQRLVELIYDSDDETVFSLYLFAVDQERKSKQAQEEIADLLVQIERNRQNRESRGVSLTPESPPPED